uniref:Uncharacterized protein n=1 Tax=Arion vulgaris TaxID=1028688 RepID=A0A0B7BGQ7_9EUPU
MYVPVVEDCVQELDFTVISAHAREVQQHMSGTVVITACDGRQLLLCDVNKK